MNQITDFFKRWKSSILILLILFVVWFFLTYYIFYEEYSLLLTSEVIAKIVRSFIELVVFLILVKIIMASNTVLNSLDSLFKKNLFSKKFSKNINHEHLIKIAKDIHLADSSILFNDKIKKVEAFNTLEEEWINNPNPEKPFIILESWYTDTLYDNGQFIMHKKYHLKMMERNFFDMDYDYIPFDKEINKDIAKEEYYINRPGKRWHEKSFKHRINGERKSSLKMKSISKNKEKWIRFSIKTKLKIDKGEEFFFEFSIADKVELSSTKEFKERRNKFFSTNFSNIAHGIRNLTFQIESYNNTNNLNTKIPFEPVLFVDEDEPINIKKIEEETIYYQKWIWTIIKTNKIPKKIRFELHEL